MGWHEFTAWLETMRRQTEGPSADPRHKRTEDTLAASAEDPWWQEARTQRQEERGF